MRSIGRIDAAVTRPKTHCLAGGEPACSRRAMNVHHLELFYYVARHGGISAAVRHIPYGIQQPAVSGQMRALEEQAGTRLFERTPFRLTPAGEKLFAHVRPFFERLPSLAVELSAEARPALRLGASELVLRDHIPLVMRRVRARHPQIRLSLQSGSQPQLERWLRDDELDLVISPVEARAPRRLSARPLARVPLVLQVPRSSALKEPAALWRRRRITEPLAGLPANTTLMRQFQKDLRRRGLAWRQSIEADSIELITCYVANGEALGINVAIPSALKHPQIRALPLADFTPVTIGLMWRQEPAGVVRTVMDEVERYAAETWPKWATAKA